MTPLSTFALELRNSLDEAAWPWTLAALRQDSLVWDSLENGALGRRALERGPLAPESWSPGALALLELNEAGLAESLKAVPLQPLPQPLAARATRTYETWLGQGGRAPTSLAQAGLLALALREQRRLKGSWVSLSAEIVARGPAARSALACLAGLSPDQFDLLRAILRPGDPAYQPELALHALLSHPLSPQAQAEILSALLDELPLSQRLGTLRALAAQRPTLAAYQAQRLIGGASGRRMLPRLAPFDKVSSEGGWNEAAGVGALSEQLAQAAALSQHVEAQRAAGQYSQAVPLLVESLKTARRLEARLAAQMALAAGQAGDERVSLEAWKQAAQLAPASPYFAAGLALALLDAGRPDDAQAYLETRQGESPDALHPALLLASAQLAARGGEIERAQQAAAQVLEALLVKPPAESQPAGEGRPDPAPAELNPDPADFFSPLARLLLDLGLASEAAQAARRELERRPNDARFLALLAQAQFCLGQPQAALSSVYAALAGEKLAGEAAASAEEALALRRLLVDILEAAGEWSAALVERTALLQRQAEPAPAELRALAHCALQAGQPQQVLLVCRKALEIDPNDGLAYVLLGQAALALGDEPSAMEHFHQATELAPENAGAWIALAQAHQNAGDSAQALTVLRAAGQAAPNSPEVHLALGEACLGSGSPTQALTALRQASGLVQPAASQAQAKAPEAGPAAAVSNQALAERRQAAALQQRIALRFGQTLFQLGHLEESRQVLAEAYQVASQALPVDPEVSYAYAKALLALQDLPPALAPLRAVVQSSPADPAPYLEYARVLLQVVYPPEAGARQALPYLERILGEAAGEANAVQFQAGQVQACQPEARALQAEALAATGELSKSIAAFRQALDSPQVQKPGWRARLSLGLGRAALAQGQIETAVAALQDTAQVDPSNPAVQRSLCEAYLAAGLREEALQAARTALAQNPSDLETLVWYADLAPRLQEQLGGAPGKAQLETINLQAIEALSRAAQIAPYRADLVLRLGQMQLQNGDREAARQTFTRLAEAAETLYAPGNALPGIQGMPTGIALSDLYQAAICLRELGDAPRAVALLERAIGLSSSEAAWGAGPSTPHMLAELAQAHWQAGNSPAALEALDQAIQLQPGDAGLFIQKSDLLQKMQRPQSALACLESALSQSPLDKRLLLRAAAILRSNGDLPSALAHAERAASPAANLAGDGSAALLPGESKAAAGIHLPAQYLAADIALSMLQPERARELLSDLSVAKASEVVRQAEAGETAQPDDPSGALPYYCLFGELALENDDEQAASEAMDAAKAIDPQHPRLLALQARLAARKGGQPAALKLLDTALPAAARPGEPPAPQPTDLLRPLAEAALELGRWPAALDLLAQAAGQSGQEPLSHLQLARSLALRAENQRLCLAVEATGHAPGSTALDEPAYLAFQSAIQAAEAELNRLAVERKRSTGPLSPAALMSAAVRRFEAATTASAPNGKRPGDPAQLIHWRARGHAAFRPCPEHVQAFQAVLESQTASADVLAALMSALGQAGERAAATKAAQLHPQHPAVLRQLALVVAETNPRQALGVARTALEILNRQPSLHSWETPLLQALVARLAQQSGQRAGDPASAIQSIQAALAAWPDEPRWHALAAEICLGHSHSGEAGAPDLDSAIAHLQEAARLEPGYAPHALALGQVYLEAGDLPHAIQVLEQATRIAPDQPEAWLALAQAQQLAGDLNQAANSAERAIERSTDPIGPLLLRGELALQTNNPRGAQSRAQAVLRLNPDEPSGLFLQARALAALGRPEEALASLERAAPLAKNPLPMQLERASLLRRTQGPDKALKALQGLAESYPEDPAVLSTLAEALLEYGQNEAALHTARLALQADNNQLSPEEQANLHYLVGRQLRRAGQLDQAVHHLSEATRHNPAALEAYLELGRTHQDRRQPAQALNVYQQTIQAAPGDPRAYYQAGMVLKESKDYLGAESMLRKAAELAPTDVSIHRLLGAVVALNLVHNRRQPAQ